MRGIGSAREGEVRDAKTWGAKLITAREIHEHGIDLALDAYSASGRSLPHHARLRRARLHRSCRRSPIRRRAASPTRR